LAKENVEASDIYQHISKQNGNSEVLNFQTRCLKKGETWNAQHRRKWICDCLIKWQ